MNIAKNIQEKTVGVARSSSNAMTGAVGLTASLVKTAGQKTTSAVVDVSKTIGSTTVSSAQKFATTTVSATKNVASTTIGTVTGSVGIVGGIASGLINPRRRGKYSGGRRLKRQNSRLAWESRVTAPYIKIDLVLSCQNLPKKSSFSQADGFCVVWEIPAGHRHGAYSGGYSGGGGDENNNEKANNNIVKRVSKLPSKHEKEIGRTEVCRENKNPNFTTTFRLEYKFQEEQHYVVRVYNEDLAYSNDLKEHDFIGGCVFSLGELMGSGGCSLTRPLGKNPLSNRSNNNKRLSKSPYLILVGQEIIETREVLEFRFSGQDLGSLEKKRNKQIKMAKDVLSTMQLVNVKVAKTVLDKFDFYFRIEKLNNDDQKWKIVWKSEVVKDNQNPTWNSARIPLQLLCDDDPDTQLKITIYDWNKFTSDELVGSIETSVNELTQRRKRGIPVFNVIVEKKRILRGPRILKAGVLKALKAQILQIPSMLQYISGGCTMDLIFAIDCTSANGDWRDDSSQHFHSSTWLNDYQAAIHKIATVYQGFEGPKDYGLWGYGAIIDNVLVPTYFSMGENLTNADKLVEAYDAHFSPDNDRMQLGPTGNLKPVIQAAMYRASQKNLVSQCYSTLVILTTGEVSDVVDTIDVVCAAAEDSPLSIVVIGVGGTGDFQLFDLLTGAGDECGKLRHSNGVPIAREIINVVSFHDFSGNASQVVVEALREVPEQFVQFFLNAGIQPMPPKALPDFTCLEGKDNEKKSNRGNYGNNRYNNDGIGMSSYDNLTMNGGRGGTMTKNNTKKRSKKRTKRGNNDDDEDISDLEDEN